MGAIDRRNFLKTAAVTGAAAIVLGCRMSEATVDEAALAQALGDVSTSDAEVQRRLRELPTGARFGLVARWLELARDEGLPAWRRLAAIDVVLDHCLTYPIERTRFMREVLAPLGVAEVPWIDMTIAQHVPLERFDDALIRMIQLPIATAVGPAAIYISVRGATDMIQAAAVSPDLERAAGLSSSPLSSPDDGNK